MWTDIWEERITSIVTVDQSAKQETSVQQVDGLIQVPSHLLHAGFNPEDGGYTFLLNVGSHVDYLAPYPRRWQPSWRLFYT
jgi:hypothetical protein